LLGEGGAGGGGGLHIVRGALADLPPEVLVTVGQVGVNGAHGSDAPEYVAAQEPFLTDGNHLAVIQDTPPYLPYYNSAGVFNYPYFNDDPDHPTSNGGNGGAYVLLPNVPWAEAQELGAIYIVEAQFINPFLPPEDGNPGGASKFGDIAMASGGTGGKKAPFYRRVQWAGWPQFPGGDGGDGGLGGTDVPGGGAPGTESNFHEGTGPNPGYWDLIESRDGVWNDVSGIGEGGGGGRGESVKMDFYFFYRPGGVAYFGNNGSKGSFSFSDTSHYGPGGEEGTGGGATINRRVPGSIYGGGWTEGPYNSLYGQIPGRNPNGVVQIRLTQIV
jgi:hypothetical protein